ncbi:MAG: Ig domain-containing protein, partial [Erysipelotrichaceae bacterium]|nr:Ig domain-containing protein [Erysipelotrichaceae bacterium]
MNGKNRIKSMLLALLLSLSMVVTYLPASMIAYAGTEDGAVTEQSVDPEVNTDDAQGTDINEPSGEENIDVIPEDLELEEEEEVEEVEPEALGSDKVVNNDLQSEPSKAQLNAAADNEPVREVKAASDGKTYIAFTSDIHNGTASGGETNVSSNRLTTWLSNVMPKYDNNISVMGFCGDMASASSNSSTFWTFTDTVMDNVESHNMSGVYAVGNHEYGNGSFATTSNSPEVRGKYKLNAEARAVASEDYVIYCLGTNSSHGSNWAYDDSQITTLTNYLNSVSNDKVIIILTHFPLHDYGMHRTGNTVPVLNAVNTAAIGKDGTYGTEDDKKIVFLWGHNHSEGDGNYDEVWQPGDKINDANKSTVYFFYAAAGCMADSEYGQSASVKGKGLVLGIDGDDDNRLSFTYYDANGNNVTEPNRQTVVEGEHDVIPVDPDIPTGDSVNITPSTSNPEESIKIAVGDTLTINVTNGSSNSAYDFTASLGTSGIAQIQGNSTVNIAAGGTGQFTVKGLAEGTVDITIQNSNTYGSQYARKGVIHLKVGEGGTTPVDPPTGDSVSITPTTDNPEESIKIAVGDTLTINVTNGSSNSAYDFTASLGTSGIAQIQGNSTVNIAAGGTGQFTVKGLADGTVDITIQNENTYGSQYTRKGVIHLTVGEGGTTPIDPPTPGDGDTYKLVDQFTNSGKYLIVSKNSAGSGYALTNPGGSSSGANMGSTGITIQSGDVDGDGTADLYINSDAANIVWTATANGTGYNITNNGDYLEGKSGNVKIFNSQQYPDRYWTYSDSQLQHHGGQNTYVVYYSNNAFTSATSSSSGNKIYIYEKTEVSPAEVSVTGVSLDKSSLGMITGDTETLTATVIPANATNKSVTWSSSNTSVATVSNGVVTAKAAGSATITVTTADGNKTAACAVTVSEPDPSATVTFVQADTLEANKEYLIANGNSGSVYLLSNEAGGSRQLKGISATVSDGKITIDKETAAKTAFTTEMKTSISGSVSAWLKNGGKYLYTNSANGLAVNNDQTS